MEEKTFHGIDVDSMMKIKDSKRYGISIAAAKGESIETYCSGSGRFGQEYPVYPDMLFQAGSVSKPLFALTVLRYADKGIIDIDADISDVISDFVKIPMTYTALLSHTAGYNVHGFPGYRADHEPLSLEDVLNGKGNTARVRRIRPYGKQFRYSGGGITLAELAFTRMTGSSLRDTFAKEVAGPLGLTRTGYFQPLDEELVPYAAFGGKLAKKEDPEHGYHYYPEHAAAGIWTTPAELTKIGIAISRSYREGGLLRKETAQRMLTPVLEKYGLCIFNHEDEIGEHGGANEGFLTQWMFSLKEDVCVASMINQMSISAHSQQQKVTKKLFQDLL